MNIEQEGIELETINPDNDTIVLPDVEDNETEVDTSDNTQVETEVEDIENTDVKNSVDEEKESLQRGLNKERRLRKEAEKKNKEFEAKLRAAEEYKKNNKLDELQNVKSYNMIAINKGEIEENLLPKLLTVINLIIVNWKRNLQT